MIRVLFAVQTVMVGALAAYTAGFGVIAIDDTALHFQPPHTANVFLAYLMASLTVFACGPWLILLCSLYLERRSK